MDVMRAIKTRRAVRRYRNKGISKRTLNAILEAATWAPSAGNLQPVRLVVVEDDELKRKIVRACSDQKWASSAPVLVVVCSLLEDVKQFFGKRGEELYDSQNAAAAIQNILLAATHYGIASNWIGSFSEGSIRKTLEIPSEVRLHAIITLGHPIQVPKAPVRIDPYFTVFYNQWENNERNKHTRLMQESILEKSAKNISRSLKKK